MSEYVQEAYKTGFLAEDCEIGATNNIVLCNIIGAASPRIVRSPVVKGSSFRGNVWLAESLITFYLNVPSERRSELKSWDFEICFHRGGDYAVAAVNETAITFLSKVKSI